jgi:hypothetical protein
VATLHWKFIFASLAFKKTAKQKKAAINAAFLDLKLVKA